MKICGCSVKIVTIQPQKSLQRRPAGSRYETLKEKSRCMRLPRTPACGTPAAISGAENIMSGGRYSKSHGGSARNDSSFNYRSAKRNA